MATQLAQSAIASMQQQQGMARGGLVDHWFDDGGQVPAAEPAPAPAPADPLAGLDPRLQQGFKSGLFDTLGITMDPGGNISGPSEYWSGPQAYGLVFDGPAGPSQRLQDILDSPFAAAAAMGEAAPPVNPAINAFYANMGDDLKYASPMQQMDAMMEAVRSTGGAGTALGGAYTQQDAYDHLPGGILSSQPELNYMGQPWGYPGSNTPGAFAVNQEKWSTNNWRLLPPPYQRPGVVMRNGIIIDTTLRNYTRGG